MLPARIRFRAAGSLVSSDPASKRKPGTAGCHGLQIAPMVGCSLACGLHFVPAAPGDCKSDYAAIILD